MLSSLLTVKCVLHSVINSIIYKKSKISNMNQERKLRYDVAYMKMAYAMAELSYAVRHKVGSIIVSKEGQVISQGYNGTPTGTNNRCEYLANKETGEFIKSVDELSQSEVEALYILLRDTPSALEALKTKPEVLHAESNAITKCAKWMSSTDGATLYVTLSPCIDCAKLIIQSGIKRVVFCEEYRKKDEGIRILSNSGITVQQIVDIDKNPKLITYDGSTEA